MPREAEPSLNEKRFVLEALEQSIRLDGRELEQYRSLELKFGNEYGIADLKLGKTRVLARISAEVTTPYPDRPLDGIFIISTELSPMASPAFETNRPPTETEVLLSRLLEKTIRRSGALDVETLCLMAGRKVWSIRADLHVLSHDGNLVDAACLAAVAALRHFRKPETEFDDAGELTVFTPTEREPEPLTWLHTPLCVTFSFFGVEGGRETSLLDATWLEEQVRVGSCTLSMNKSGEICQAFKPGGGAVEAIEILRCAGVALEKVKQMSDLLDRELNEDAKRRDNGLGAELVAENDR